MFDDSFDLSRAYFAALQTLRKISNMVEDAFRSWTSLREDWDRLVPLSHVFSNHELSVAAQNWTTATKILEKKVERVHARIACKTDDIKSLRDGVHTHRSLTSTVRDFAADTR
jgi:hypothetical protein